jgi:low affinity Fe/Cu permease
MGRRLRGDDRKANRPLAGDAAFEDRHGTSSGTRRCPLMREWLPHHLLTLAGTFTARPVAFVLLIAYAAAWIVFDREGLNWHGVTALMTLAMALFIQRSEHRDTQAIQAKLDELLHVHALADNAATRLDEAEPEQIEEYREKARAGDKLNVRGG